jgi:hypothetical protein
MSGRESRPDEREPLLREFGAMISPGFVSPVSGDHHLGAFVQRNTDSD